jgi:ABC-type multidrug transport system ATPase subunit
MDAVVVRNLSKSFGKGAARRDALKNISLQLPAGSMTALIGPDGAGKTTLLRLLAGILTPSLGRFAFSIMLCRRKLSRYKVRLAICRNVSVSMKT